MDASSVAGATAKQSCAGRPLMKMTISGNLDLRLANHTQLTNTLCCLNFLQSY